MNELNGVVKPNVAFFKRESLKIAFDVEQLSRNLYKHFHVETVFLSFNNFVSIKSLILNKYFWN